MALSPPCPRAHPFGRGQAVETIFSARLTDRSGRVVIPLTKTNCLTTVPGVAGYLKAAEGMGTPEPRIFVSQLDHRSCSARAALPLWSAALCCRLSAALSLPAAGRGRITTRRYSRDGLSWTMMVAGPPSTIHQSAHVRPNTVVRSTRGR
jgi:hypothetical protein